MLDTLLKIGKWQSSKMMPIERFLAKPKPDDRSKYFVVQLVFDLDEHRIYPEIVKKFDFEKDPLVFLLLKTLPGNNKAIYSAVEKGKINNLLKSFFGKINPREKERIIHGELYEKAKETGACDYFLELLDEIFRLKGVLIDLIEDEKDNSKSDEKKILKEISVNKGEDIAAITAAVKSQKYGFPEPTPVSKIKEYQKFVNDFFLTDEPDQSNNNKMCYASGTLKNDVGEMKLETRYSLNKMFITETKNYASLFNKNNFTYNYQVSRIYQKYLDLGSSFLLMNFKIPIAGIQHVMIPSFLSKTEVDFDLILEKFVKQTDFLLRYNDIKRIETGFSDWINDIYWLNFISIDSDGNYFKSNDLIKDISTPWFFKIVKTFDKLNNHFFDQYQSNTFFNFYTYYQFIPVKKDTKRNEALELFKDIFEQRAIDRSVLFKHFTRYLIAQRSGQFDNSKKHRAYSNIREQSNFDYAIKNGVMNYLAFIQFLRKINLINIYDMEENTLNPEQKLEKTDYHARIEYFFKDMGYTKMQKALFYLGKVLNRVAYAQARSNHQKKPVLDKLNYNGMDRDAVLRLHLDLREKVRQYVSKINLTSVEYDFARFMELFNPNKPADFLTPEENVFYILSGYSFGMFKEKDDKENEAKSEELDN
ncbi:MAG: hypothetical protein JXA03_14755 [Bacteroidales bacterium]|nr:hypothetical protein [Bacteroidales bacterium]